MAGLRNGLQPGLNERGADSVPLHPRQHTHRREPDATKPGVRLDDDAAERDVADDRGIGLRDHRDEELAAVAKKINQIGLEGPAERRDVHLSDRCGVSVLFQTNADHRAADSRNANRVMATAARTAMARRSPV